MELPAAVEEVLRAEREWLSAPLRLDVPALERLVTKGNGGWSATGRP